MNGHPGPSFDQQIAANKRHVALTGAFETTFNSPAGQEVMDHMVSRFINTILGPESGDKELRYREGQRALVAYMKQMSGGMIGVPYPEADQKLRDQEARNAPVQ